MTLLSVRDLQIGFRTDEGLVTAVDGVSFDIAPGEVLGLVGESGSGKSVTAKSLMQLNGRNTVYDPSSQITLDTKEQTIDVLALRRERDMRPIRGGAISMIFQEPMTSLNPVMRIGEQLGEVLRRHQGLSRADALLAGERALDQVRIPDPARRLRQYPHELSGGLRQRVMIAIALACRPDVLIADEPTTALDVTTQAEVLKLLKSLQAEIGMAVLFITHDMGVVAEIADRACVLRHGRTEEQARVETLFRAPQSQYARDLMAATPKLGLSPIRPPVPDAPPVLSVRNLSKSFHTGGGLLKPAIETRAVRDVSFDIRPGETLGLVGESGCGKSTLSRTLMRLIEPDSGTVTLDGRDLTGLGAEDLRRDRGNLQMVFQDPYASLNPRIKVRDLITEPAYLHTGLDAAARADLAASMRAVAADVGAPLWVSSPIDGWHFEYGAGAAPGLIGRDGAVKDAARSLAP